MTKNPGLRVALGADGVSIWSSEIFDSELSRLRDFLSRAFTVQEVHGVELQRARSFGRVRYGSSENPAQVWRKLSRALSSPESATKLAETDRPLATDLLYLDVPGATPVRVSRIGDSLSTWRVRHQSENALRLSHPVLRNRPDVVFRLEEELAAIFGVEDFSASAITGSVSIRFDARAVDAPRLARELEKAWPRLLDGLDGPPSRTRLFAAVGLAGLSFTGQYLIPPLRPLAVAGVALYSAPNVVHAAKDLARGRIGLPALYSTGLGFMLASGRPFASSVIASLMQFWPHLTRNTIVRSQRRLFAAARQRALTARVPHGSGVEVEVSVDDLQAGDTVVVRAGELVAVDGIVEDGFAAVVEDALFAADQIEDKSQGDTVTAGTVVRDGSLTIRVERRGSETAASHVASLLPHATITGLPSSDEAERIANRNAKPTLAAALVSFGVTRTPRVPQALIRPDYATAPRLSAQLSAFRGIADGLQRGVLFRNAAALDRASGAEVYVFDDTAGLDRRRVEVALVQALEGTSSELVGGYAVAAHRATHNERARALAVYATKRNVVVPVADSVERRAGVTRYRDSRGCTIEVATTRYLSAAKLDIPPRLQTVSVEADESSLRPLWVVRDGAVIGVVRFARTGEPAGAAVVAAIRERNKRARILSVSRNSDAHSETVARRLGIEFHGGKTRAAKLELLRGIGQRSVWIGDGSDRDARELISASTVSISIAALSSAREDAADILLPHHGLSAVIEVLDLARAHRQRIDSDYRTVYAANLLGVAGAFGAGPRFNSLHAGLLSNAGTGIVYARHAWDLERLASRVEKRRAGLKDIAGI